MTQSLNMESIAIDFKSEDIIITTGIFELGMLICFGISWPISIAKTIKSKSVKGKSVIFLYIILLGYILGIFHKIFNDFNWIICFYIINAFMVSIDVYLWYKYNINKK